MLFSVCGAILLSFAPVLTTADGRTARSHSELQALIPLKSADAAAEASEVVVRLRDGRVIQGRVSDRTDGQRLWLIRTETFATLESGFAWSAIAGVEIDDEPVVEQQVQQAGFDDRQEESLVALAGLSTASADSHAVDGLRGRSSGKLQSVAVTASPANWNRDARDDGLRLRLVLVGRQGVPVAVRGRLDVQLKGFRRRRGVYVERWPAPGPSVLKRWSVPIRTSADATGVVWIDLPWTDPARREWEDFPAAVEVRLSVPGQGVFEAVDETVALRPYTFFHEQVEQFAPRPRSRGH